MNVVIRKWRIDDKSDLAMNLNNLKVLNNLRDGLPYPYTEHDAEDFYPYDVIGGQGQYICICDNT